MIRILATLLAASVLAGCSDLPFLGEENAESRQVIELIGYAQKTAALPAEEQQHELNASNQVFSKNRGIYWRVKLAVLLCLPGTAFNDDARAASLLEPLASANGTPPGPIRQFAGLLYAQVNERLREQRRTAQLKEQLDALKAIERTIIEREQGRPK
jgi:hypothetical protein